MKSCISFPLLVHFPLISIFLALKIIPVLLGLGLYKRTLIVENMNLHFFATTGHFFISNISQDALIYLMSSFKYPTNFNRTMNHNLKTKKKTKKQTQNPKLHLASPHHCPPSYSPNSAIGSNNNDIKHCPHHFHCPAQC